MGNSQSAGRKCILCQYGNAQVMPWRSCPIKPLGQVRNYAFNPLILLNVRQLFNLARGLFHGARHKSLAAYKKSRDGWALVALVIGSFKGLGMKAEKAENCSRYLASKLTRQYQPSCLHLSLYSTHKWHKAQEFWKSHEIIGLIEYYGVPSDLIRDHHGYPDGGRLT